MCSRSCFTIVHIEHKESESKFYSVQNPNKRIVTNTIQNTKQRDRRGLDHMVVGFKLSVQSVPITTNVVRSNPTQMRCT